jgi:hypothetical protein
MEERELSQAEINYYNLMREMTRFQVDTLNKPKVEFDEKQRSEVPMRGAEKMHTPPSKFLKVEHEDSAKKKDPTIFDNQPILVSLYYRFNELWSSGVPFGGPGPPLLFSSMEMVVGTPITTTALFYNLGPGNNYYDHEMWIDTPATSPFAVQVDLSLEWSTWPGDVGTGTFFTGTCTLPAGGGFSNLLRIGPPALGFKLTTFATTVLTHTATITIL